ncbi:5,6-dimethylbenzimidazole synthase [Sphingobium aromaticiconvertens]|uniref:5,6-dimethylbenzimidazole synthase n=1 Tax=Sphingobium aromaticiconvertens TaxID=365341 RepID=UPI003016D2D5
MPDDGPSSAEATQASDLEKLLVWRRDVRHFDTRPVPEDEMDRLFAATRLAPSVGNAQPWRFVRLRTPALRTTLADHVDAAARQAGERYTQAEQAALYASLKLHGLREAPEIVAVFSDESPREGHGLGIATMPEALRYSTIMAIHTLWLTAQSRGIGLGWVSILEPDWLADLLDAPAQWHFIALLCIGYAKAPSDIPELDRRGWQARRDWRAHVSER